MNANRFDAVARALAGAPSRRQFLLGLGGAALAAAAAGRPGRWTAAQSDELPLEFDGQIPDFDPIFVPRDPVPLGGDTFYLDGNTFTIDAEVAAEIIDTQVTERPTVPFLIGGETYFIDPGVALIPQPHGGQGTPTPFSVLIAEAICPGGGLTVDVEIFEGHPGVTPEFVAEREPPVGSLRWNFDLDDLYADHGNVMSKRYCSGTLISADLFLTAAHCLDQCPQRSCEREAAGCSRPCPVVPESLEVPKIDGTTDPISRDEIARSMHVDFHYQMDEATHQSEAEMESFPVIALVEDQLGGLDYAILRLGSTPGLKYRTTPVAQTDAVEGSSALCIIGHPGQLPKQVETGQNWGFDGHKLFYKDLSTWWGNSGSGILASPQGTLVGVHTNGGCDSLMHGLRNYGVRISTLLEVSPTLREIAGL